MYECVVFLIDCLTFFTVNIFNIEGPTGAYLKSEGRMIVFVN